MDGKVASQCSVLGQDTILSQCLSPPMPGESMGTDELNAGCSNPVMDWHPI